MLALNCFTASLWYKVEKQDRINSKTQYSSEEMNVRRNWTKNFESLNSQTPTKSPDINLIWTLNDSYTGNSLIQMASESFRNALCIEIKQSKNVYTNPEVSICSVWNDPFNSIHAISRELSEKVIEPRIDQIEEIILNPKYADNIALLLTDETYLVVNTTKLYSEENSWELITMPNAYLADFLNNSKKKLIRKKINTIVRVNYKNYNKSYISFLSVEKEKSRVIILEWENIYDPKKDTKFIPLSLLYPVTVVMDIFLLPIGAILFWTGILEFRINPQ